MTSVVLVFMVLAVRGLLHAEGLPGLISITPFYAAVRTGGFRTAPVMTSLGEM
ncbi:MAG TPA: hypothetical protein VMU53_11250 [Candidatus Sulfotelmatobacter sp.]|nr:hypothetical protein [Candidatus Sulfotelmatobacter sp.]